MELNVKFIFHFRNGKSLECVDRIIPSDFECMIKSIKTIMRERYEDAIVYFSSCVIRMSEVIAVEWEELS